MNYEHELNLQGMQPSITRMDTLAKAAHAGQVSCKGQARTFMIKPNTHIIIKFSVIGYLFQLMYITAVAPIIMWLFLQYLLAKFCTRESKQFWLTYLTADHISS